MVTFSMETKHLHSKSSKSFHRTKISPFPKISIISQNTLDAGKDKVQCYCANITYLIFWKNSLQYLPCFRPSWSTKGHKIIQNIWLEGLWRWALIGTSITHPPLCNAKLTSWCLDRTGPVKNRGATTDKSKTWSPMATPMRCLGCEIQHTHSGKHLAARHLTFSCVEKMP